MFKEIRAEIDGMMRRDPAARSRLEVVFCYPGFHALIFHRIARAAWRRNWHVLGRFISHLGRFATAIEIHPGAEIGKGLFIDHGTGVVIGEMSVIGDDVTLYQGVTLGGVAPSVDSASQRDARRHPTLENGVIVGSGAQILGPLTIGTDARVGANSVVVKDVPPGVTVTGIPARVVMPKNKRDSQKFMPYGTPIKDVPDPLVRAIEDLRHEITALQKRLDEVEGDAPHDSSTASRDTKAAS